MEELIGTIYGEYERETLDGLRREIGRLAHALQGLADNEFESTKWADANLRRTHAYTALNRIIDRGAYQAPTPAQKIEEALVQGLGIARALAENAKKWRPAIAAHYEPDAKSAGINAEFAKNRH